MAVAALLNTLVAAQLMGTIWLSWWSEKRYNIANGEYVSERITPEHDSPTDDYPDWHLRRDWSGAVRIPLLLCHLDYSFRHKRQQGLAT